MSEPVDPNEPSPWAPPPSEPYTPPPPYGQPAPGELSGYGQPAYGTPPAYGQPSAYDTPPAYGQPPAYGTTPAYGQSHAPGGDAYPPPYGAQFQQPGAYPVPYPGEGYVQPRPSRTKLWVGLGVVAALAAGGATAAIVSGSSSTHHVSSPDTIGTYTRLHSTEAQTVEKRMRDVGTAAGTPFFKIATIASYASGTGDVPNLITVTVSTQDIPGHSSQSAQDLVDQMFEGLSGPGQEPITEDAGSHGGVLECTPATFGAAQETLCGWSGHSTTGIVVSLNPPLSPGALADLVRVLRAEID